MKSAMRIQCSEHLHHIYITAACITSPWSVCNACTIITFSCLMSTASSGALSNDLQPIKNYYLHMMHSFLRCNAYSQIHFHEIVFLLEFRHAAGQRSTIVVHVSYACAEQATPVLGVKKRWNSFVSNWLEQDLTVVSWNLCGSFKSVESC